MNRGSNQDAGGQGNRALRPAIVVRPARPEDAASCAVLHSQGFTPGWSAEDIAGWLGRGDVLAAIVDAEAGPVAFALVLAAGDDAELLTVASAPEARRHGLARAVLARLDTQCRLRGLKRWILEVAADNVPALGLYRALGFREIALRKGYYPRPGGPVDATVMACETGFSSLAPAGKDVSAE